ncbi:MAG: hypothetical protein WC975_05690 [Phycisphaerae bacterium]
MTFYDKKPISDQGKNRQTGLPLREGFTTKNRLVLAHHLIFTGYGHWIANDPRGSESVELREKKFEDLGPIHPGRKRIQPPRGQVKEFYKQANPRMEFEPFWFDQGMRNDIANAFSRVIRKRKYTVWGCAILSNHVHLCVRRHRDNGQTMWKILAGEVREEINHWNGISPNHPLWSQRVYVIYLHTPDDIRRVVGYIQNNPIKERLEKQEWEFVQPYNGWPYPQT